MQVERFTAHYVRWNKSSSAYLSLHLHYNKIIKWNFTLNTKPKKKKKIKRGGGKKKLAAFSSVSITKNGEGLKKLKNIHTGPRYLFPKWTKRSFHIRIMPPLNFWIQNQKHTLMQKRKLIPYISLPSSNQYTCLAFLGYQSYRKEGQSKRAKNKNHKS